MRTIAHTPGALTRLVSAFGLALVRWAARQLIVLGVFYVAGRFAWRLLTGVVCRRALHLRAFLRDIEAEARAELHSADVARRR